MANSIFNIALMDRSSGKAANTTGGKWLVVPTGTAGPLATLLNPDSNYAALTQPITSTSGVIRFAIAGAPITQGVDIYGFTGDGSFIKIINAKPGDPTEWFIGGGGAAGGLETAIVPFLGTDYPATVEKSTGLQFKANSIILPHPSFQTLTVQSGKTIQAGLLASESGGAAAGFIDAISMATAGTVVAKLASTGTLGSLLRETTTGAAAVIPVPYAIAAAVSISFTGSSGSTTAAGFLHIPFFKPPH